MLTPLEWTGNELRLIDQTVLPIRTVWITCSTYQETARAIKDMKVRGAPAIGVSAAYGMALAALNSRASTCESLLGCLTDAAGVLNSARPTAINLAWAVDRMLACARSREFNSVQDLKNALVEEADGIHEEDIAVNRAIGASGNPLVPDRAKILTHCNAGALATAAYGTALGVIRAAVEAGKNIHVWVDETRPFLQGARLTAWELMQDNIPCTLLCDNMAAFLMARGEVDLIVVGADRIASCGDVANKIGTYGLARLAECHRIPFYIAAPLSTFDPCCTAGENIPIEERPADELAEIQGIRLAPLDVDVWNPAFDVTPAEYITGIITEKGVIHHPDMLKVTTFLSEHGCLEL